jgi:hypothetical protein
MSSHSVYGVLPTAARSDDGHVASTSDMDRGEAFNLMPLSLRSSGASTPQTLSRSHSRPRRSSPLPSPEQCAAALFPMTLLELSLVNVRLCRANAIFVLTISIDTTRRNPSISQDPPNVNYTFDETDNDKLLRLQHDLCSKQQFWKIFTKGLMRFLIALAVAVLLVLTIFLFSTRDVISSRRKKWFNVINTGISLALGISNAHGFKSMAIDLRWGILSWKIRSLSEV